MSITVLKSTSGRGAPPDLLTLLIDREADLEHINRNASPGSRAYMADGTCFVKLNDRTWAPKQAEENSVNENTTANWNAQPEYIPKRGEIVVYSDYKTVTDDLGNEIDVPGVKIGDGSAYLIDLPFAGTALRYELLNALQDHAEDTTLHVTPEEKAFWDNKLNYDIAGEELILNRM